MGGRGAFCVPVPGKRCRNGITMKRKKQTRKEEVEEGVRLQNSPQDKLISPQRAATAKNKSVGGFHDGHQLL